MKTLTKTCNACKINKSLDDFYKDRSSKDGRTRRCAECQRSYGSAYYARDPNRANGNALRWRTNNPAAWRNSFLKSRYGITLEQYNKILAAQDDHCALCPATDDLTVDHNHSCCSGTRSCGECVRGILCRRCNLALGGFCDDIVRLKKAISYVQDD